MDKLIFHVPEWQGELFFSKEVLVFAGVILLVIVGTLFCFWGYKYFKTILLLGIGIVACYGSYLLVEPMTPKLVIRMFLTVSLTFLGLCFAYFLDIIFSYILDRLHVREALGKRTYLLAAPLGAAVLGLTIYYFIWRDGITAVVISCVCLVVGLPYQHVKRKKQVRFKTYNDLLRLPRPEMNTDGLEYAALGTAAFSAAPVAASEPEFIIETIEPEPELVIETIEPEPELVIETIEPESEPVIETIEPEPELVIETIEPEPELVIETIEPEPELVIETIEPEPELVIETIEPEPELVIETIEPKSELVIETIEPEPEPVIVTVKPEPVSEAEPESDLLVIKLVPEPRRRPELPAELSDSAKELIHKKMESEEDVLEEAFFVKQISELIKAEKREKEAKEMAARAAAAAAAAEAAKAAADAAAAAAAAAAVAAVAADAVKVAAATADAADAATAAADAAKTVAAVTQSNASLERQTDAPFHHMEITVTSKHDRKLKFHKKRKKHHAKNKAIKDAYVTVRLSKGRD